MSLPWSRFTDEQRRAAFLVDRSVVSAAAAGAGKTQVLAVRYCACLLRDEHPLGPERVLAITFTREAAANLRARIDAVLRAVLAAPTTVFPDYRRGGDDAELTPAELEHLRRALAALPSAPIGTVDSFCRDLASEHAEALGIDPALAPPADDGPEWRQCEELAWSRLRGEMAAAGGGDLLELVSAYGEASARQAIAAAAAQAESLPEATVRADDADPLRALVAARSRELEALPGALAEAVAATKAGTIAGDEVRRIPPRPGPGALAGWIGAIAALKATGQRGAASAAIKAARELTAAPAGGACLALLAQFDAESEERWRRRAARLAACVARYRELLDEVASSRGLAGFAATARAALRLARQPRIAGELAARYRHVLLDEAQDLNRLQGALVEAIERAEPAPRIFTVGDRRQSIYAFRHAEPALFRSWETTIEARGGAAAPLGSNFRSHPELVVGVRALVSSAALREDFAPEAIEPGRKAVEFPVPAVFARWRVAAEDPARGEADQVARLIADSLIQRGRSPQDHAVILRTRTRMREYADALERAGIPVDTDYPGGLVDAQECWDVEAALRLCLTPCDRYALAIAAAGPWGVPDPQDRRLLVDALASPDTEAAAARILGATALGALLGELAPLLAAEGPASAVRRLARDPRLAARYGSLPLVRRRIANLARLASEEETARDPLDAAAFIARLAERRRLGADAAEAGGERLGSRGVRLLTIHAAKGLEWPVVIVPELARPFGGRDASRSAIARAGDDGLLLACGAGAGEEGKGVRRALAAERLLADRRAEEARLLYVACTRAVEELHLVMAGDEPSGEEPVRSCAQWVSLAGLAWTPVEPSPPRRDLVTAAQPASDPLPPLAAPPPLPRPRVVPLTELVERVVHGGIAAAATGDRAARRALGDAAHRVLELHGPGMPLDVALRALDPFAAIEGDAVVTAMAGRLASPELVPGWTEASVRLREQDFIGELAAGDPSRLVSARCDLLLRTRDGWRLFDYKTGEGEGGPSAALQLSCYAALAAPHLDGPIVGAAVIDLRAGRMVAVPIDPGAWSLLAAAWPA